MPLVSSHSQRVRRVVSELRRVRVGPMSVFESAVVASIEGAIRAAGGYVIKTHGDGKRAGLPDLIGCYRGRFFAIEVKAPGKEGTLTKRQAAELERIRRRGGIAFVGTSSAQVMGVLEDEVRAA